MARLIYPIRPVQHAISVENPALFISPGFSPWASNGRIDQNSFKKRWGYYTDRSFGRPIYAVALYQEIDGTRHTIYLTDREFIYKTGTTVSYGNTLYTTGGISDISVSGVTVTGNGVAFTANAAANDAFILDVDHTSTAEMDAQWTYISAVPTNTSLTLSPAYSGTTGAFSPVKDYKVRKSLSVPTNERWSWAIVGDKFCFTNGNHNVKYWAGSGYIADLDSTYAVKARYCLEYANRLFLADTYVSSVRMPTTLLFSKEGDPTNWTDSTAGELDLLETDDYITGLGKVGFNLVVYKEDNILVFSRVSNATSPIERSNEARGIGCVAPYSIIPFAGTNAFIGRDNFYIMNGDTPEPIGGPIRDKFFSIVGFSEVKKVFSGYNPNINELYWTANTTSDGQVTFVWNHVTREWYTYQMADEVFCWGKGAL